MNGNKKHQGYVLLESLIAFAVVTLLMMEIFPLLIFMRQQEEQQTLKTESLRYLYELATAYQNTGEIEFGTVTRRGYELTSSGVYDEEKVILLRVEGAGESYEIRLQE